MTWDVEGELENQKRLQLEFATLWPYRALTARRNGWTVIQVDHRLTRRDCIAALAHELVHIERGLFTADTPPAVMAKEECHVRRVVARRLISPHELDQRIRAAINNEECVTLHTVADWFDAADDVAEVALQLAAVRARSPQRLGHDENVTLMSQFSPF